MRHLRGRSERGAALIIALLVMLVLSAMGLVALRATSEGAWTAASHRMQSQSTAFSDSVVQFGTERTGLRAQSVYDVMRQRADRDMRLAADDSIDALRRGGYVVYVADNPEGGQASLDEEIPSGRLLETGDLRGIETEMNVRYRFIVRDPIVGPPAVGFGENYCFNRVTVASEALVASGEGRSRRGRMSMSRHASEAFIGPIECGTQF